MSIDRLRHRPSITIRIPIADRIRITVRVGRVRLTDSLSGSLAEKIATILTPPSATIHATRMSSQRCRMVDANRRHRVALDDRAIREVTRLLLLSDATILASADSVERPK